MCVCVCVCLYVNMYVNYSSCGYFYKTVGPQAPVQVYNGNNTSSRNNSINFPLTVYLSLNKHLIISFNPPPLYDRYYL